MKKFLTGIVAFGVACCALGGALTFTRASAEDAFSPDTEGSAVYPGGQTQETVLKALKEKVEELNAAVTEVNEAGGDLAAAYAEGEILAYSIAAGSNGLITQTNKRSGWKVWEGVPLMDLKFINAGYGGWGDQYVAWLCYNGVADEAYIVTGEFADRFQSSTKLNSPTGDMFRLTSTADGYVAYQNFAGGYIKSENGQTSVVEKKNVVLSDDGASVTEVDANPMSAGVIGAATAETLQKAGIDSKAFAKAFTDAYEKYLKDGYNVGYPFSTVQDNGRNSGGDARYGTICTQNFRYGDSVSSPWGGDRSQWAFLAYNFAEGRVYLIADEFHYTFEAQSIAEAQQLGDPVSDAFVASDGNRYQNFEKGYMKADGSTPQNKACSAVVLGKNIDAEAVESVIDINSKIGKFGPSVTDSVLPEGYTAESFSAAIKAAYAEKVDFADGETLAGVDLVSYANGYISQKYTDNNGKIHMLAYSETSGDFVYLRPEVVSKAEANTAVGAPAGERVLVAEADGQKIFAYPYTNGYVKLTISEQVAIEGGEVITIINESAVVMVGAVYDKDKNFFETVSYADSIDESLVNNAVDNAFAFLNIPDKATLAKAFKDAYEAAFAVGFSAGKPADEGITWWVTGNSGIVKLTLAGGNGNANFWGDNTLMTYNPIDGKVYITTGAVANCYGAQGASGNGWALGEMKLNTKTGVIVQQFDIHDTVVETRPVYIIVTDGTANKVEGTYDFEANANGGEWVDYISQFGGSISKKALTAETSYKVGDSVSIDFSQYIENKDGYSVTWSLASDKGELSDKGVYTVAADTEGKIVVTVEVYSAFDKLTFDLELNVTKEAVQPGDSVTSGNSGNASDGNSEEKPSSGCGSVAGFGSGLAFLAAAGAALVIRKKKGD